MSLDSIPLPLKPHPVQGELSDAGIQPLTSELLWISLASWRRTASTPSTGAKSAGLLPGYRRRTGNHRRCAC